MPNIIKPLRHSETLSIPMNNKSYYDVSNEENKICKPNNSYSIYEWMRNLTESDSKSKNQTSKIG